MKGVVVSLLALCVLAPGFPAIAGGSSDYRSDLKEWLRLVQGDQAPTVENFRWFQGSGSEWELELERAECARRGWNPPATSQQCARFIQERSDAARSSPSLFFERLREIIPKSARASEPEVLEATEGEGVLPYELIRVRIGGHDVEFGRAGEDEGRFGRLAVNRIDGKGIDELVDGWAEEIGRRTGTAADGATNGESPADTAE